MQTEFIHSLRALSSLIEISMDQLRRANTLALIDDGFLHLWDHNIRVSVSQTVRFADIDSPRGGKRTVKRVV